MRPHDRRQARVPQFEHPCRPEPFVVRRSAPPPHRQAPLAQARIPALPRHGGSTRRAAGSLACPAHGGHRLRPGRTASARRHRHTHAGDVGVDPVPDAAAAQVAECSSSNRRAHSAVRTTASASGRPVISTPVRCPRPPDGVGEFIPQLVGAQQQRHLAWDAPSAASEATQRRARLPRPPPLCGLAAANAPGDEPAHRRHRPRCSTSQPSKPPAPRSPPAEGDCPA